MSKHLAEVDILGSSFTIRSDESPEHMEQLIEHFSSCVSQSRRAMPQADSLRIAILSGLNITDELFKTRSEIIATGQNSKDTSAILSRLIAVIDRTIEKGAADEAPYLSNTKPAVDELTTTLPSTTTHKENPSDISS